MALKRRRENDETRKLPDMGKALGWSRMSGGKTAVNDARENDSIKYEAVTGDRPPGASEYASVGKGHVKTKKGAVVKEANEGFNKREDRRVQGIKDGSSARRKMAWDEIQNKSDSPAPVVKIDSGKK
jgi:hypothetical protein